MNNYTGVHHVAFATADMDRTVRFWRDLLGMRLVYAYGRQGYRQYFFEISRGTLVSFFEWEGVERIPYRRHGEPVTGPFTFDHLSIGVPDLESLWRLSDILAGADQPVSDVIDHGFIYSIYSYDPNGTPIEFSCDVPGVKVSQAPLFRDEEPSIVTAQGAEPVPGVWPPPDPLDEDERVLVPGEGKEHFPVEIAAWRSAYDCFLKEMAGEPLPDPPQSGPEDV